MLIKTNEKVYNKQGLNLRFIEDKKQNLIINLLKIKNKSKP